MALGSHLEQAGQTSHQDPRSSELEVSPFRRDLRIAYFLSVHLASGRRVLQQIALIAHLAGGLGAHRLVNLSCTARGIEATTKASTVALGSRLE